MPNTRHASGYTKPGNKLFGKEVIKLSPSRSRSQEEFFNILAHNDKIRGEHGMTKEQVQEWRDADKKQKEEGVVLPDHVEHKK